MSRLADPALCPDCRGSVRHDASCSACGLVLRGPLGERLWMTMLAADRLVEELRVDPTAAPAPVPVPALAPRSAPVAPRVQGRAVPALLLTLGALLVFVAASLFLAFTWSQLPLGFRALLMVALTAVLAGGADVLSRRSLRGSAEALWGLAAAVLALDIAAAHRADLVGLGAVSPRATTIVAGLVVAAFGFGATVLMRRTPLRISYTAEVTLVLGVLATTAAACWTGPAADGLGQVVGVLVLGALALGLRWHAAELAAAGVAVLGGLTWLDLVGKGAVTDAGSRGEYLRNGQWWLLLAAAGLAAAPAFAVRLPRIARVVLAGSSLTALALLGLQPGLADTEQRLQATAVLLLLAGLAASAAGVWASAARVLAGLGAGFGGVVLVLIPTIDVFTLVDHLTLGGSRPDAAFPVWDDTAPWVLLPGLVATVVAAVVVLPRRTHRVLRALAPTMLLVAVTGVLIGTGGAVWAVTAALVAASLVALVGGVSVAAGWVLVAAAPAGLAAVLATASHQVSVPTALGLTLVAAATLLLAPLVAHNPKARILAELTGGLLGLAALVAALPDAGRCALVLTLVGSAVALVSVLHDDRERLGWLAGGVLVIGTAVRVGLAHTPAPEAYALPAAALLLGVGTWRLQQDPQPGSWPRLGSGLSLALVPSLLLALGDPGSLRTALVVVGAAVALGIGLERRWQAPLLHGTGVLAVLALRFLLPVAADVLADPLGAWILFGAVGSACLLTGVLWEQSLHQLRTASRFVGSLR